MAFLNEKGVERLWEHTVNKINETVAEIDVQDEIYIGEGELPEGYTLQIDPEGDAAILANIPFPSTEDAGLVVKVQEDGTYGLGEAGLSEVSADIVSEGTFAGKVMANPEAVADITVAQVRNIVCGTADVVDVLDTLNVGDVYFTVEEVG